jgi:hypothetical protein
MIKDKTSLPGGGNFSERGYEFIVSFPEEKFKQAVADL